MAEEEVNPAGARRRLRSLFGTRSGRFLLLGVAAATYAAAVALPPELFPLIALAALLTVIVWTGRREQ